MSVCYNKRYEIVLRGNAVKGCKMGKFAEILVSKRFIIFGVMTALAVAMLVTAAFVPTNTDMTKYLPDDSSMKIGIDLMAEEFPEMEQAKTIRVMAEGLDDARKAELIGALEAIPNVSSVAHDPDTDVKGEHSLFTLSTDFDYGSPEELAIEDALERGFDAYDITYKNDEIESQALPFSLVVAAVVIAMVILIFMSESWTEPFLFLIAIGYAVFINMGTNILLGEISTITASIAAILQMVLSMDYSIILINRYRQEKATGLGKVEAMARGIRLSIGSIASSSLTTVAGLLALCFMHFKIGFDIGVVLAKGVFISMICVLTVLPTFILGFDKLIERSAKKALHIPMGAVAKFSRKFRYVLAVLFVLLFVGVYIAQQSTGISFTVKTVDPIADVFPKDNMLVMVYENRDEPKVAALADELEAHPSVKQVFGYPNLLGKQYTSAEFADAATDLGAGMGVDTGSVSLDPALLDLIYYHYHDGSTEPMTMSELLTFLSEDVLGNETFADMIDSEIAARADTLAAFADPANLTVPKTAGELADLFDMDVETVESLLLYYYTQSGTDVESGSMTVAGFASFVLDEVAVDPTYGAMFDDAALAQLEQLSVFADPQNFASPTSYTRVADLLGIDDDMARLLFVYVYANGGYEPTAMTVPEFAALMQNVANDPNFSGYLDESMTAQIGALAAFADKATLTAELTPAELAAALGIDEQLVEMVFALYNTPDVSGKTIPLADFAAFIAEDILANPALAGAFDETMAAQITQMNGIITAAKGGAELSAAELAAALGMDETAVAQMLAYASQQGGAEVTAMTLSDFIDLALELSPDDEQLSQLNMLVMLAEMGLPLDAPTYAQVLGVDESMVELLFRLYFGSNTEGMTMSLVEAVDFLSNDIAADPTLGAMLPQDMAAQLATVGGLVDAAMNDTALSYNDLAALAGVDASTMKLLATYRDATLGAAEGWQVSLQTAIAAIRQNGDALGSTIDAEQLAQLGTVERLMQASSSGAEFTADELAAVLGMNAEQLEQLYLLYESRHGDTSDWTLSVKTMLAFIADEVLPNPDFADMLDDESVSMLDGATTLVDAVIGGEEYTSAEAYDLLGEFADAFGGSEGVALDESTVDLLYFYRASTENGDPTWTLSIDELFGHLNDELLADERFAAFIDDDMREQVADMEESMRDGVDMLKTDTHSRMIIYTTLPEESAETSEFVGNIITRGETFEGDMHLIGNSSMNYELEQTFSSELMLITLLSAAAIFLIVLLSFRNLIIPIVLVLIVQCGVYITITVVGIQGYAIHYMALLIVECILMGATIDYGILFTNYYREHRASLGVLDALRASYRGSMHTITTSGLIIVLVTAIIGYTYSDPTISQICRTISIGVFAAILLILFILPGMLTAFDRLVTKKTRRAEDVDKAE